MLPTAESIQKPTPWRRPTVLLKRLLLSSQPLFIRSANRSPPQKDPSDPPSLPESGNTTRAVRTFSVWSPLKRTRRSLTRLHRSDRNPTSSAATKRPRTSVDLLVESLDLDTAAAPVTGKRRISSDDQWFMHHRYSPVNHRRLKRPLSADISNYYYMPFELSPETDSLYSSSTSSSITSIPRHTSASSATSTSPTSSIQTTDAVFEMTDYRPPNRSNSNRYTQPYPPYQQQPDKGLIHRLANATHSRSSSSCSTTSSSSISGEQAKKDSHQPFLRRHSQALVARSMSLSDYRRRLSSLITNQSNSEVATSAAGQHKMTRARSLFVRNRQEKAVASWRHSVAQLDVLPLSPSPQATMFSFDTMSETQQRNEGGAKEQALCRFIIHELHTTEQSYCRLLQMIYTNYMRPMEVALQAKDPLTIKKSNDILVLFCHLPQLLQLSERFLDQFTEIDLDTVINTFTALQDDFAIFLRYAVHYRSNWKSIRKACRSNALFLNIDQECLARKETNRLGMADYLIAPIQRVPRYCLLLKDLLRYTSKCDPRYPALESVLLKMMSLAAVMDKDKRRAL